MTQIIAAMSGLAGPVQRPVQSGETSLFDAPVRRTLVLSRTVGEPDQLRRLAMLGLRRGARVRVVQRTVGNGRIVEVAGARMGLDRDVLANLFAEVVA